MKILSNYKKIPLAVKMTEAMVIFILQILKSESWHTPGFAFEVGVSQL
jgi:hypothetical protein